MEALGSESGEPGRRRSRIPLPDPVGTGVRPAAARDVAALARTLARAFRDDPFHRWMFPSDAAWARRSHRSFAALLRAYLGAGTVLTDPERRGAAIWSAPGDGRPGRWGGLLLAARFLPLLGHRLPRVVSGFGRVQAAHPRRPHWYLAVLGTDPRHQGRGVGGSLVRPALAACDAEGLPAYLEASRPENVPYYRRFGFEVTREIPMPGDGPTVWGMLREPAGGERSCDRPS